MKKIIINIILIILSFIIYFLQSNFFNWFTIVGIMPNLFIILILFIGLFGNRVMSIVYSTVIGIILDLLFEQSIGVNLIGFVLIGTIATIFDKNFSKDSRVTIMFMVFGSTILFEITTYLMNYILNSVNIEIFKFITILIVEVIYNIIITIIIYPILQKFGYYIENEYKGNKILTRYF